MPERFDIFKGFKAAKDMIGAYPDPYEEERKSQRELQLYGQKKAIDARYDAEASTAEQGQMNALLKSMGGKLPTGTTGKFGNLTIPLNPELSEGEARTFGNVPIIDKGVRDLTQLVSRGVLEGKDNFESAKRGLAVDSGQAFLTFGNKDLAQLQSSLNSIKANTVFSEGGKALSNNEKQIIFNLFNVSGKDKNRIISDVQQAVQKYHEFIEAKRGGMMGYDPYKGGSDQASFQNQSSQEMPAGNSYKTRTGVGYTIE